MNIRITTASKIELKNGCFRKESKTTCIVRNGRGGMKFANFMDLLVKLLIFVSAVLKSIDAK